MFELNGVNVGNVLPMQKEEEKKDNYHKIQDKNLFNLFGPAAGLPSSAGFWLNQSTHNITTSVSSAVTLRDDHPKLLTFRIFAGYLWSQDRENNHLATCPAV